MIAVVAAIGLAWATGFVAAHRTALVLAGALFLLALGWHTLRAPPPAPSAQTSTTKSTPKTRTSKSPTKA